MGKRIISQARGHGSSTYRVKRKAFSVKPAYPVKLGGNMIILKLFSSAGHSAPIVKISNSSGKIFYNLCAKNLYVGQKISVGGENYGDIASLGDIKSGTRVFNIENSFQDGGRFVRTGGNSALIVGRQGNKIKVVLPSKKEKLIDERCRATIGELAGQGRLDKPILKAGKQYYIKKAKSKLWPRTSAVKMNAIDHPFGSGRGKRIKSKIIQRFASPGQTAGLLRPRRTGRKNK
jgi:large subunit ribosomal protein L2